MTRETCTRLRSPGRARSCSLSESIAAVPRSEPVPDPGGLSGPEPFYRGGPLPPIPADPPRPGPRPGPIVLEAGKPCKGRRAPADQIKSRQGPARSRQPTLSGSGPPDTIRHPLLGRRSGASGDPGLLAESSIPMIHRSVWARRALLVALAALACEQAWRHGHDYLFADELAAVVPGRI